MQDRFAEAFENIQKQKITKRTDLLVPVNLLDSHWCLVKVTIENNQIKQATLWDPMKGGNRTQACTTLYSILTQAAATIIPGFDCSQFNAVVMRYGSIQTNAHSCMDYCLQEALKTKYQIAAQHPSTETQAMMKADNAFALRSAVLKSIISTSTDSTIKNRSIEVIRLVHQGLLGCTHRAK